MKKNKRKNKKARKAPNGLQRLARRLVFLSLTAVLALCGVGSWYVRRDASAASWPFILDVPLVYFGERTAFLTDGMGLTGRDVVYDYDEPPPAGRVTFAGLPERVSDPAPRDIRILDRGEFVVGFSPSLGHAVWAAYHVPPEARFEPGERPNFRKDPDEPTSPAAGAYARTGYDRGHLAPNHAIETRFGPDVQRKTFYTTNIAPQLPALNRDAWRQIERLIADLWTAKYGELWVLAGTVSSPRQTVNERLSGTTIGVPEAFWCVVIGQNHDGVRALAFVLPQTTPWGAFPVHGIVSIDEIERMTGLELLKELPPFIARPLEAEKGTRLWPVRLIDLFRLVSVRLTQG